MNLIPVALFCGCCCCKWIWQLPSLASRLSKRLMSGVPQWKKNLDGCKSESTVLLLIRHLHAGRKLLSCVAAIEGSVFDWTRPVLSRLGLPFLDESTAVNSGFIMKEIKENRNFIEHQTDVTSQCYSCFSVFLVNLFTFTVELLQMDPNVFSLTYPGVMWRKSDINLKYVGFENNFKQLWNKLESLWNTGVCGWINMNKIKLDNKANLANQSSLMS